MCRPTDQPQAQRRNAPQIPSAWLPPVRISFRIWFQDSTAEADEKRRSRDVWSLMDLAFAARPGQRGTTNVKYILFLRPGRRDAGERRREKHCWTQAIPGRFGLQPPAESVYHPPSIEERSEIRPVSGRNAILKIQ